ncbi:hypothetical protein BsWGS_26494 [Bradybaena similaris]
MSDVVDNIPAYVNQAPFSLGEARVCTGPDDQTLLDLIGRASPYPAVEFLKEARSFSHAALNMALILACQRGFKYVIQKLIQLGADIECRDASGKTPLLICVENHYFDLVHFLVARRADVKAVDCAGNNALILSISFEGSAEMLHFLLEKADHQINHQNNDGYTAVMKALEVMDVGLLKLLLEIYFCENCSQQSSNTYKNDGNWALLDQTVNCKGETAQQIAEKHGLGAVLNHFKKCISEKTLPILAAVEACDLEILHFLCVSETKSENEINVALLNLFSKDYDNEQNPLPREIMPITKILLECGADLKRLSTSYPVSVAVDAGDYDLVELLCKHSALLKQQRYRSDKDPLRLAAKNGRMDLIELLLKYNADVNTHSFHKSPLECALIHGHIDCARFLVNHGAKMDISLAISSIIEKQDPESMKILFQNYNNEIVSCLLEDGKNGNSFLLKAVKCGNLEIIEQILQAGVDVNIPQRSGATPIVESKNGAVALLLIRYGADVNHVTDNTNETPLMRVLKKLLLCRTSYDKEDVVRVLLENGASVNAKTRNGTRPLMLAARYGQEAILQTLLQHGADCSNQDNNGNTALLHAILGRCSKNAIILIQSMKNNTEFLNLQNNQLFTALMCEASYDNCTVLSELISAGADVNITDENGDTALHHAVKSTSQSHLKVLINSGCNINHQNNAGLSPLMLAFVKCNYYTVSTSDNLGVFFKAIAYDNCKIISELINSGANVNITDANGDTALHHAVKSASQSNLKALISGGCDINHQNKNGLSPLMLAAVSCHYGTVSTSNYLALKTVAYDNCRIISELIDSGADVNITDANGNTALHHAVACAQESHLEVLINGGCDINHQNNNGLSPLMLAALNCNILSVSTLVNSGAGVNAVPDKSTIMSALIDRGANVNITDVNGNTALHLAVACVQESHLKVLINCGCDINHQNNDGLSPLMLALNCHNHSVYTFVNSGAGMNAVLSALIDCGADVNITDANGNTALHLAVASEQGSHLEVLINHGCDINHQNNHGLSPLMLAVHRCNYCSVSTLINLGVDVNAVNHKDVSKTALSCIPKKLCHINEIFNCITALLDKGANASFLSPWVLPTFITEYCHIRIPKLIQCGLGPTDIDINDIHSQVLQMEEEDDIPLGADQCVLLPSVSPMCLALLIDNVELARYFWRIMFMTTSDLYLSSNKIVRRFLQIEECEECLSFLDKVSTQPMSLFKMCFVAVTSAVGASPGREARINKLPLPWIVKDKLLFKSDVESYPEF